MLISMFIILIFVVYLAFLYNPVKPKKEPAINDPKYATQMRKLWNIAQTSMKERKPLRAEKALLTILKFDEKNAAAYNRLGILYAKSQKYDEAIECFEIAQSLDNNASSLHNAGLIYLETGAYEKASMAFQQALKLEGDLPARYIALAKAEEKLGHRKAAVEALEGAFELDHNLSTLRQILALHEAAGDTEAVTATTARIESFIAETAAIRARNAAKAAISRQSRPATTRRTHRTAATRRIRAPRNVVLGTPKRSVKNTANLGKAATKATRTTTAKKK